MGILESVATLPPEVRKLIEENIDNAEFEDKRLGGTDENPVKADFLILNDASHVSSISIGRGRKFRTTFTKKASEFVVEYRFENHHRSRGWTLRTDLIFFDQDGDVLLTDSWRAGISEKDFGSYKVRRKKKAVEVKAEDAFGVLVVCYRDPSLRFKDFLDKLVDEIKEEIIDAIKEEIESWFDSEDNDDSTSSQKKSAILSRMEDLRALSENGEDLTLADT